jgi:V8-like Glu-specific endopeptidase
MRSASLAAVLSLLSSVRAQEPPSPQLQPYALDSGYVDAGPQPAPIVVGAVTVTAVAWLQLRFDAGTNLPAGSRLRLTSARDGAVQWFDGGSLRDYQNVSAFFNGDSVEVALVPSANSRGNRVAVGAVRCGEVVVGTDLICGPTDTRVLSTDPRVGRIDGCCTTFLVDARNLVTAGHCMGGIGGQLANFNVPLSDAAGNPQFPPPQDQYALLPGSLTSVANGLGDDYAVMSTVRNSNTGKYPGEQQGWFLTAVPSATTSHQIRVTGYGTSAVNATWSLAQKSDVGARVTANTALLSFVVTVTGCNSGSPAIHAVTDQALGVVTHGGCSGSSGNNFATGFGWAPFFNALQLLRQNRVAGTTTSIGAGCAGGSGVPALGFSSFPDLGGALTVQMSGLEPIGSNLGLLAFGFSNFSWNGTLLPLDLLPVGMPGCFLRMAPAVSVPLFSSAGACSHTLSIPNSVTVLAATIYCQYFSLDPTAPNAAQITTTNAARITFGN